MAMGNKMILLKPKLKTPILFTHIPKCGGTSVEVALQNTFQIPAPRLNFEALRRVNLRLNNRGNLSQMTEQAKWLLCYTAEQGAMYLGGHFPITVATLSYLRSLKPFIAVTLLREPYARLESNYIYRQIRLWELGFETYRPLITGQEEIFLQEQGQALCDFYDTDEGKYNLQLYTHMFGEGCYDLAQETLAAFDIVGVLEKMPWFTARLSHRLQKTITLQKLNQIEHRSYQSEVKTLKQLFQDGQIKSYLMERMGQDTHLYQRYLSKIA
jgi:hypothetical protein